MKLIAMGPITVHGKDGPKDIAKGDEFEAGTTAKAEWLISTGAAQKATAAAIAAAAEVPGKPKAKA